MQDGRYAFRGKKHLLLPLLFLLPQLAITVVFFFYPAGEALMGSFYMEDSFGLSKEFVGLDNFITLFSDPSYLETLRLTLVFSLATIVLTMGTALLFAVLADQVNWGGTLYKSFRPHGNRSRITSCSSSPGCTPSPARSSRPRPSTARPRGGGSARSFSRFCRPQASSCLW